MSDDNIVRFPGASNDNTKTEVPVVVAEGTDVRKPVESVVTFFEQLLDAAKRGEVTGFVCAITNVRANGSEYGSWARVGTVNSTSVAMLDLVRHKILTLMAEG